MTVSGFFSIFAKKFLTQNSLKIMQNVKTSVPNKLVDDNGNVYGSIRQLAKQIHVQRRRISKSINEQGYFRHNGVTYSTIGAPFEEINNHGDETALKIITIEKEREDEQEYQQFLKVKEVQSMPFQVYKFKPFSNKKGHRYAVALFSDAHIEETVIPESVNFLNEYNIGIAEQRIENYFRNLARCLVRDEVNELIFASLGDTISGYIHQELEQTNQLSPLEATLKAQSLIYSGLKYLCENENLSKLKKIRFIGIVGNHSRVSKKMQHNNGYKMSYEWLMYQNIKKQCELTGLPIDFYIPESELAVVNTADDKVFIFAHGFQIRGGTGNICGIYPALNRLCLKYGKVFKQDMVFIGHFHSSVNTPNAIVNGSIIGYNAFALSNGMEAERPCQQYVVYDTMMKGQLLARQIYCD